MFLAILQPLMKQKWLLEIKSRSIGASLLQIIFEMTLFIKLLRLIGLYLDNLVGCATLWTFRKK